MTTENRRTRHFMRPSFRVMWLLLIGCHNAPIQGPSRPATQQPVIVEAPASTLSRAGPSAPASTPAPAAEAPRASEIPSAVPWELKPEELKPHRLRLILTDTTDIRGMFGRTPYVAADGSTAIVLVDSDAGYHRRTLVVRSLDGRSKDIDLPLRNDPCDDPRFFTCKNEEAEKQVRIANQLLAKHSWVMFRLYQERAKDTSNGCSSEDLRAHFRILDYEVFFQEPRLRIVREDGVVITDRDYQFHDPAQSEECRRGTRPYAGMFGIDVERRVMAASLMPCHTDGCDNYDHFYFFRLPPPKRGARTP